MPYRLIFLGLAIASGIALFARAGGDGNSTELCARFNSNEMVWVPGGRFRMGSEDHYPEERPVRTETVAGFWIDKHELTNDEFARFVTESGYITEAEQPPPKTPGEAQFNHPGSAVFGPDSNDGVSAWRWMDGADWRHPDGPGSSIDGRGKDPVVQISFADAVAYARWAGKQLPTEVQWEYAARGGLEGKPYAWGDAREPDGSYRANYYQGVFPVRDLASDGHAGRAPVGCYPANGYGAYDMIGNVWEWTASQPRAEDPAPKDLATGVIRGGSFLCAENYCQRYRPSARQFEELDLGTNHLGVRFVMAGPPPE